MMANGAPPPTRVAHSLFRAQTTVEITREIRDPDAATAWAPPNVGLMQSS